jgi:hypothetical protein
MKKLLPVLLITLAMAACARQQPRLDTTTVETTTTSLAKMSESLSPKKRQKLANATTQIMAATTLAAASKTIADTVAGMTEAMKTGKPMVPPSTLSPDQTMAAALKRANGMTADEIIALGEQLAKEVQAK